MIPNCPNCSSDMPQIVGVPSVKLKNIMNVYCCNKCVFYVTIESNPELPHNSNWFTSSVYSNGFVMFCYYLRNNTELHSNGNLLNRFDFVPNNPIAFLKKLIDNKVFL